MRRTGYLLGLGLSLSLVPACAGGEDVDPGNGTPDTGIKADTGSVIDTGAPLDTGTPVVDSGSEDTAVDDTGIDDTGVADGATDSDVSDASDSSATDSGAEDSSAVDSTVTDSTVTDSTVTDSIGADTSVTDSTVTDSIGVDTAIPDTTPETGGDAGTIVTTRVHTGNVTIQGLTTDGYAVVADASDNAWAVPLAGGAAVSLGSFERLRVSGAAVFLWSGLDLYEFGALRVWTASAGVKNLSTKSLAYGQYTGSFTAAASPDGSWIAYTDNGVTGASDSANFKVAKNDGTSVKTVFTQHVVWDGSASGYEDFCVPYMDWVGSRFVTSHCTPTGTTVSFDISAIDPAAGTATKLGSAVTSYWSANEVGTHVALNTSGTLRIVPVTGGTSVTIDTNVESGVFTHAGNAYIYRTTGNALRRSPIAAASPVTLIASGVSSILSVPSPDDNWLLYAGTVSSTTDLSDVRLASATTPGSGTVLHATTNGAVYSSAFTADSAHAIFYTNVVDPGYGNLVAAPVGGGSSISLGSAAWLDFAVSGSKLVFTDNFVATSTSATTTLRYRDLSGSASSVIEASMYPNFVLTAARDKIVYTINNGGASDGVWVATAP